MNSIADIYRFRCSQPSDINEHLEVLHDLVVDNNAQTVVELGVRSGNTTAALLAAVELTGGHLWSVDIDVPNWPRAFHDSPHGSLIIADDLTVADRLPDQIDVLFIDTSHYFEQTLAELRLYGPKAKWIALHDTELEHPYMVPPSDPAFPVKCAIEVWTAEVGREWSNRPNCWGLGLIEPQEVTDGGMA